MFVDDLLCWDILIFVIRIQMKAHTLLSVCYKEAEFLEMKLDCRLLLPGVVCHWVPDFSAGTYELLFLCCVG